MGYAAAVMQAGAGCIRSNNVIVLLSIITLGAKQLFIKRINSANKRQFTSAASSICNCTTKGSQTRQVKAARISECWAQRRTSPEQWVLEGCGDLGLHHGMTGTCGAAGPATRISLLVQ